MKGSFNILTHNNRRNQIMKKIFTIFILLVLSGTGNLVFAQTVLINEDFESYAVGSFPSAGGWVLLHNGAGDSYQTVTNTQHHGGTQCMTLTGTPGWAAHMYKLINHPSVIYTELWMMASANNTGIAEDMGEFLLQNVTTGGAHGYVYFNSTSNLIKCSLGDSTSSLISFIPNQWYKLKMKYDLNNKYMDVWVNDSLIISNLYGNPGSSFYDSFELGAEHGNTTFYFDDIMVTDYNLTGLIEPRSKNNEIRIYPNPASDKITIEKPNSATQIFIVSIKNIQGQEVWNEKICLTTPHAVNISGLSNGIYFLSISNEQIDYVSKILIQK
jgi:hypothetical protein